jgi:hypothetical protein
MPGEEPKAYRRAEPGGAARRRVAVAIPAEFCWTRPHIDS